MDRNHNEIDVDKEEQFMKLLLSAEREIFRYILSLVPHLADAEDLLQETCSIMWRKLDDFEIGTNFTAWGVSIARYRILDYRRNLAKNRIIFNEDLLDRIVESMERMSEKSDARVSSLHECISKLKKNDHELIQLRYFHKNSIKKAAVAIGRPVESVYKSMTRIHDALLQCVRRSLRVEG